MQTVLLLLEPVGVVMQSSVLSVTALISHCIHVLIFLAGFKDIQSLISDSRYGYLPFLWFYHLSRPDHSFYFRLWYPMTG